MNFMCCCQKLWEVFIDIAKIYSVMTIRKSVGQLQAHIFLSLLNFIDIELHGKKYRSIKPTHQVITCSCDKLDRYFPNPLNFIQIRMVLRIRVPFDGTTSTSTPQKTRKPLEEGILNVCNYYFKYCKRQI